MQPKSFRALEILHKYVIMYPIPKRMVILMKIDVITYRDKLYDNMLNGHTVIVIDVLRCTSAIIAALDNGAAKNHSRGRTRRCHGIRKPHRYQGLYPRR